MKDEGKRSYKKVSITLLSFVFICWGTMLYRSADLTNKGDVALAGRHGTIAITYFEHSALLSAPFNIYSARALDKIKSVVEKTGDNYLKRQAENSLARIKSQLYPANLISFNNEEDAPGGIPLARRIAIHLFFFGWMAGSVYLFFKGFTIEGIIVFPELIKGGTLFCSSLLIWLFLLSV